MTTDERVEPFRLELIKNNLVRVEWEDIGEGVEGDFDPEREGDVELLRFTVSRNEQDRFDPETQWSPWEQVDDASYCTAMPVGTDGFILVRALWLIMDAVYDAVIQGDSIKRACEDFSWLSPESTKENQDT